MKHREIILFRNMSHNQRKPDACDMLAEALKQMDNLLSDTSQPPPLPQNGHCSKLNAHQHNGRPSLDGARSPMVNGGSANTPTAAADGTLARRLHATKAIGLCGELRVTLGKLEDRAAFLQQLPSDTRKCLLQWFGDMDKDGILDQSDGGMSPRGVDNMKLDLVVENNRLRLRLARMERELQSLEDKFSAAQRRISDLHSSLNERTIEVTGLTSRLARSAHASPDRNGHQELEKMKHVVELLKIADNEKNCRIEELKRVLNKYKQMEEVLVQLKKSQILENIQLGHDRNGEDVRSSGDEDGDNLSVIIAAADSNNSPIDEALQDPAVHLRSLSAPRLAAATHQALAISASLPLSSLNNFGDSSSSYDNLASYTTKALAAAAKKENFGSHDALTANGNVVEPPSPVSPSEKRPPLPPHSTAAVSSQAATTQRRQNRIFASVGKGILKSQGNRWSRSTPSLLVSATSTTPRVEEEASEGKKENGEEEEDKDKPGSRSQTPTRIQTKKSQPSGLKKFFDKMKRRSQDLDDRLEDFKRSPLRSTVGARLGVSEDIYDVNQPFARWDTDRVALWLHVLGLSMYIGNCRRWVKNGEQLLKASNRDLEKELEIHNRFHRKKLQLALQAVTSEKRSPMSDLDHNWVARWLDDIGLPQYKDQFYEGRIDGRLLNYLTVDELVQLKVTNAFHHLSFKRAIQVLRMNKFNQTCLIRRPATDDESPKNCPTEVMLWTNHRIMEWLRSIDLSEYAPNLRGSGVHGALMVLEPRFGAEVFATLLSIPASKTLLRRHLSTHFVTLVGNTIQMQKRELESRPGYTALATNQKVKPRRSIFRSDKPEEFVCPMDANI